LEEYIKIYAKGLLPDALKDLLAPKLAEFPDIRLKVERTRALDPPLLIAALGAIGTCLGPLITGLLSIAAKKPAQKIVLIGRSGRRIEVPADTSPAKLARYIEDAKQLDVERIDV
jgi:hypothetical protein